MYIETVLVLAFISCINGQGGPGIGMRPVVGPGGARTFVNTGSYVYATCYFNNTYSPVKGRVDLRQNLRMNPPVVEMRVQSWGLPQSTMSDAEHAMHVHQWGDTGRNCYNAGPHFDADAFSVHGGPASIDRTVRHDGDLGNMRQSNDGFIDTSFNVQNMMLIGEAGIMGRSIVMHEGRDDLGTGRSPISLQTGNSGAPIACCVIGLADATNWNNPLLMNGKFVNSGGLGPINPNVNMLG
ncbi:hypothetical protein ACF0H5_005081 [Mactra antiquata]